MKARKDKYYDNLKLALKWNRDDIARTDIFSGEEKFKPSELASLMEMALVLNRPKFVQLLLENGLNSKTYLDLRRLLFLYNSGEVSYFLTKMLKLVSILMHHVYISLTGK